MTREHPLAPHRLLPLVLVLVFGGLTLLAVRGPVWYRRMHYPLEYREVIGKASKSGGVDPYLVTAVMHAESGFDPDVVSQRGAVGLMQVMPETAEDIEKARGKGVAVTRAVLRSPDENARYGVEYLRQLIERYHGDTAMALAAYNAGMVNADEWVKAPASGLERIRFPQTKHYVGKVLSETETYRKLYPGVFAWTE